MRSTKKTFSVTTYADTYLHFQTICKIEVEEEKTKNNH